MKVFLHSTLCAVVFAFAAVSRTQAQGVILSPSSTPSQYTSAGSIEPSEDIGESRRLQIAIGGGFGDYTEAGRIRPQFEESFSYRFADHDRGGIFAGLVFGQSFDEIPSGVPGVEIDGIILQFSGRFGAELPIYSNDAIHLYGVPFAQLGFVHAIVTASNGTDSISTNDSAFMFGIGGEVRLGLADDFFAIFVRPLGFNFMHGDSVKRFLPEYQFLAGAALRF